MSATQIAAIKPDYDRRGHSVDFGIGCSGRPQRRGEPDCAPFVSGTGDHEEVWGGRLTASVFAGSMEQSVA